MDQPPHARFRRRGLAAVLTAIAAVALASMSPAEAQPEIDLDSLITVVDDPTFLARAIDQRIGSDVTDCMNDAGFEFVADSNARFELQAMDLTSGAIQDLEVPLRDAIPQVIDPGSISSSLINPAAVTIPPTEFVLAPTVAPDLVDPAIAAADLPLGGVVEPERTDLRLRVDPELEGYGITLDSFEILERDPNLDRLRQLPPERLRQYEEAFYGTALVDIESDTIAAGCAERIGRVLETEVIPQMQAVENQLGSLMQQIEADPEYTAAVARWSECLSATDIAADVDLATPAAAVDLVSSTLDSVGASDRTALTDARQFEVELATADYRCRAQTTDLAIASVLLREGGEYSSDVLDAGDAIVGGG